VNTGKAGQAGRAGQPQRTGQAGETGKRILLVRLRQIGDVVFTTPAVSAVREYLQPSHLAYLVEPAAAAALEEHPAIDELMVAPRVPGWRGIVADVQLISRLRARAFDLAIDFHGGPRASILTWLSGAPVRVGYEITGRAWMYTLRVGRPRALRPRHSVENQWDLLRPLGIPSPDPHRFPVLMPVNAAAAAQVDARLGAAAVDAFHQLVVMHVSAGNPFRRWPIGSFAAVAAALARNNDRRRVIVTSGPSELDAARQVIEQARRQLPESIRTRVMMCGEFSLSELRALVDRAALYIGGDTGPMHIAATSRVPIVALYGPTLPARSAPWRPAHFPSAAIEISGLPCRPCDQRRCEPGDFRCLARIDPGEVIQQAERAMAGRNV
jgi:ADP-heptose:LPS heptosyltransferase